MIKKTLVIVESPTKAKTIKKFLSTQYHVEASVGHIRDLPQTAAEIPAKYKPLEWSRLGIDVENDFAPLYVIPKDKSSLVRELKALVKDASAIYLATDEDREGESISWHLLDVLKPTVPVKRMVFHEITQSAITKALETTRDIDMNLVNAQETRRILDRLFGYTLSPLIWKKISYGLSAGRVQSPGLRLIVEREMARARFQSAEYWDLKAFLHKQNAPKPSFEALLVEFQGRKVASGKDFNPETGEIPAKKNLVLLTQDQTKSLVESLSKGQWAVKDITEKEVLQRPSPPFITSTLQQEGNRKLGLSAKDTMRTAQKLYEEGFITYMRTDSPGLSQEALSASRKAINDLFGADYLPAAPRLYSARSKGAQESHEAIRPSGSTFIHPDKTGLTGREKALYELIWKRTLASQMSEAKKSSVVAHIAVGEGLFVANGVKILFPGFLRVYVEDRDDPEEALDNMEVLLPHLEVGENLTLLDLKPLGHQTKPPARYTEAALVQRLEKEGIGRPSTYATIISTLLDRGYVQKKEIALAPTFTGMAVTGLLEKHFSNLVDYEFTSQMEEDLDKIASGETDRLDYLRNFYLDKNGLKAVVDQKESLINAEESRTVHLPQLEGLVPIRIGRFGPYIVKKTEGGDEIHASLPESIAPGDLRKEDLERLILQQTEGPKPVGQDPATGKPIYVLTGRYGPHIQLGDKGEDVKPRTVSLPKGLAMEDVDLEKALRILSLPRTLGKHPESGKDIITNNGRFGPYVGCDGDFRSLKKTDDVYTVTLERALELLGEEKKSRAVSGTILDFETHDGKRLVLVAGRYGPYIKWGIKNIGLPEEWKSEDRFNTLTKEIILPWLAEVGKKPAKKTSKKKKS